MRGPLQTWIDRGTPRLWLLTSAAAPFRTARSAVRGYLSTIVMKRDSLSRRSIRGEASLELFDLSDAARLQAATADTDPLTVEESVEHGWTQIPQMDANSSTARLRTVAPAA